jgi:hypothetical protein
MEIWNISRKQNQMNDEKLKNIFGFFVNKGLLYGDVKKPVSTFKIEIEDIFYIGENIEPRVLEVFPAALIHFPKTFIGKSKIPKEMNEIIKNIKKNKKTGPNYKHIEYKNMYRWAQKNLNDKRTRKLEDIKVNKTFRFKPDVYKKLREKSKDQNISATELLEKLILSF